MPAPGHTVVIGDRPAANTAAPSTANGFMVGYTEKGGTDPILLLSLADAENKIGGRVTDAPLLYDSLDTAFREGATAIYVRRIIGGSAKAATKPLLDSESKTVIVLTADSVGAWGNELKAESKASGANFTITIKLAGTVVEATPSFATSAEAITWLNANSNYVTAAAGEKTGDPKDQTIELKEGDDKHGTATTGNLEEALDALDRDLGPGQVAAPGFTAETVQKALLEHAAETNRRALIDLVDTDDPDELVEDSTALRGVEGSAARFGAAFAPWAIIPGLSLGTTRTVPYSAVQMGLIARSEAEGNNPNKAAAGKRGRARYAQELTAAFSNEQRSDLNDAGVNAAILVRGTVTTFGNRTLTNPTTDPQWKSFSASRVVMGVAAKAGEVMENYDFEQIDGHGYVFKALEGDLAGDACMPYYIDNALYGQTPAEAFQVNTGPDVNTPATIEAEEIKAQIVIRVSPTGERLEVEVVKVASTESI